MSSGCEALEGAAQWPDEETLELYRRLIEERYAYRERLDRMYYPRSTAPWHTPFVEAVVEMVEDVREGLLVKPEQGRAPGLKRPTGAPPQDIYGDPIPLPWAVMHVGDASMWASSSTPQGGVD